MVRNGGGDVNQSARINGLAQSVKQRTATVKHRRFGVD